MSKKRSRNSQARKAAVHRQRLRIITGTLLVLVVGLGWMFFGQDATGLQVGQEAPRFTLPNALGGEVRLTDYVGKQPVLVYFSMGYG